MTTQADKKEFWFAVLVTVIGLAAVLPAQVTGPIVHGGDTVNVTVVHGENAVPGTVESAVAERPATEAAPTMVERPAAEASAEEAVPGTGDRRIVVSLADRKLALVEGGKVVAIYRVAVGKRSTPSPVGEFRIVSRVANPAYYHEGKVVAPGPGNPVGTRWMGLSEKGYGIHGTNLPGSIGRAASHGCIRVGRRDLEQLFTRVQVGDVVEIRGERDAELAAIFGDTKQEPALARTQLAQSAGEGGAPGLVAQAGPGRTMQGQE